MNRDTAAVLHSSLARDGALAEIVFHWSQLNPRPTKPVAVHRMRVVAHRTALGVAEDAYKGIKSRAHQEIGAAIEFLGCDGCCRQQVRCAVWRSGTPGLRPLCAGDPWQRVGGRCTDPVVSSILIARSKQMKARSLSISGFFALQPAVCEWR